MKLEQIHCKEAFSPFFDKDWNLVCALANRLETEVLEEKWGEDYFDILENHEASIYKIGDYFAKILKGAIHEISNGALSEIIKFMAYLFKEAYHDYNAGIGDNTPTCKWFSELREKFRVHLSQLESLLDHGDVSIRLASNHLIEEWEKAENFIVKDRNGFPPITFRK